MPVITRAEYMAAINNQTDAQCRDAYQQYYRQFVTAATIATVGRAFGTERLTRELRRDPNLNNIDLRKWDSLCYTNSHRDSGPFSALLPFDRKAADAAKESITRATLVCIAKQAARMIVTGELPDDAVRNETRSRVIDQPTTDLEK